jgi:anthranilate phosphoribosyltransferase
MEIGGSDAPAEQNCRGPVRAGLQLAFGPHAQRRTKDEADLMSIAAYIREIGRGREGARSLTHDQAHDLMSQVLDARVSDLEIGAFTIAMRVKGETTDELIGFERACRERCMPIESDEPVVVVPSYNGARKLPNLTPLLALLLAQEGVRVLVHGPARDPARVGTLDIFRVLGLPVAQDAADVRAAWQRHEPVFMDIARLCGSLSRLLEVRWTVGLRNSGHTVAKLMEAVPGALRVVSYTHPEYAAAQTEFVQRSGANAMVLRGTEGEPVADARRTPRMEVYLGGVAVPQCARAAAEGVVTGLPLLPASKEASATALYIQGVISGQMPAPAPLLAQAESLALACELLRSGTAPPVEPLAQGTG